MLRSRQTVTDVINETVASVVAKVVPAIERRVAALVAEKMKENLTAPSARRPRGGARRRSRVRPQEMTKWVADRRARRVPTFVIELTGGLDTKKKIVAKYGPGVVFEKGKPLPKAKAA
jgi:hypothetical protein